MKKPIAILLSIIVVGVAGAGLVRVPHSTHPKMEKAPDVLAAPEVPVRVDSKKQISELQQSIVELDKNLEENTAQLRAANQTLEKRNTSLRALHRVEDDFSQKRIGVTQYLATKGKLIREINAE